jgi:hypothetical protein
VAKERVRMAESRRRILERLKEESEDRLTIQTEKKAKVGRAMSLYPRILGRQPARND